MRVDDSDPWFRLVYDDQWRPPTAPPRIVATYRGSDGSPKEQFVYHHAGRAGPGGGESSSYIDAVVLRDRDMTNGWAGAADGTLEERTYYCQNWRADVVALVTSGGAQIQQTRYGEYGEAYGLPQGDTDGDGDVNSGDTVDSDQIQTWINGSAYDVRGDLDLDGDVDSTDKTAAIAMAGTVLGWGSLSLSVGSSAGGNRKGYAGYENDGVLEASLCYHVRHRVYHTWQGRWTRRDPLEYIDSVNTFAYVRNDPTGGNDISGLASHRMSLAPSTTVSIATLGVQDFFCAFGSTLVAQTASIPAGGTIGRESLCSKSCRARFPVWNDPRQWACINGCRYGYFGWCKEDCQKRYPNDVDQDACMIGCLSVKDPGAVCKKGLALCVSACDSLYPACLTATVPVPPGTFAPPVILPLYRHLACRSALASCKRRCDCSELMCRGDNSTPCFLSNPVPPAWTGFAAPTWPGMKWGIPWGAWPTAPPNAPCLRP